MRLVLKNIGIILRWLFESAFRVAVAFISLPITVALIVFGVLLRSDEF